MKPKPDYVLFGAVLAAAAAIAFAAVVVGTAVGYFIVQFGFPWVS